MVEKIDFVEHISANREHLTSVTDIQKFLPHFFPKNCFTCSKQLKRNNIFCEFVTTTYDEPNVINIKWYPICGKCMQNLPNGFYGYVSGKLRNE